MPTVIVHIMGEESVMGEIEKIPDPGDNMIILRNPRRKDGRDLDNIEPEADVVIWPITRINLIELVGAGEGEKIITFVRE
ncbi:MAG: hypothetical protein WBV22_02110 [Anaerolineaceae bacterium]